MFCTSNCPPVTAVALRSRRNAILCHSILVCGWYDNRVHLIWRDFINTPGLEGGRSRVRVGQRLKVRKCEAKHRPHGNKACWGGEGGWNEKWPMLKMKSSFFSTWFGKHWNSGGSMARCVKCYTCVCRFLGLMLWEPKLKGTAPSSGGKQKVEVRHGTTKYSDDDWPKPLWHWLSLRCQKPSRCDTSACITFCVAKMWLLAPSQTRLMCFS